MRYLGYEIKRSGYKGDHFLKLTVINPDGIEVYTVNKIEPKDWVNEVSEARFWIIEQETNR